MRIAVVYHLPNPGGITRFTHALIDGILSVDESAEIDYFISDRLLGDNRVGKFRDPSRVKTIGISDPEIVDSNLDEPTTRPAASIVSRVSASLMRYPRLHDAVRRPYTGVRESARRLLGRKRGKHWYEFSLPVDVAADLATYDVVYMPFPYYMEPATIRAPLVGTFHDFNHLYFRENFGAALVRQMNRQLKFWTSRADVAVVSTKFVEGDLLKYFDGAAGRSAVIFVAPYSFSPVSENMRLDALDHFGLRDQGYLIYPSNHSHHKNLLGLIRAADVMKRERGVLETPVVFTGFGTDGLGSRKWPSFADVDDFLASSSLTVGEDVRGLGFVTDAEVDALTRSAALVVSTSLYEAGCGPALDAWQFGVPVAFSNIPPFVEQLDALGVEAWVFDPRDPDDIAKVLGRALSDRAASLAMAERSQKAIAHYTWKDAASAYLSVFSQAIDHYRASQSRSAN